MAKTLKPVDVPALITARVRPLVERGICRWFAKCCKPATGTTPHPVLGDVPTCDRCHKFATGEER